jgi:polysaccharide deacetylase family protein (PEP-CTERM system associated)
MPVEQPVDEFRADIRAAKTLLEDLANAPIRGYRAPSFAIDDARLQVVFEEGYVYDSSHNPVALHDRYGTLHGFDGEVAPDVRRVHGGGYEFSIPLAKLGPAAIPVGGGGYFRLYPGMLFRALARRARQSGGPVVVYLHPWEFDPEQPRVSGPLSASHRFRHYQNLARTGPRLDEFIRSFAARGAVFSSMGDYLDEVLAPIQAAS